MYSGYHFDIGQRSWVTSIVGHNYDMSIFTESTSGPLPFGGGSFDRYSDLASMFILYGDAILFAILAWYFDHIISSNRGRGDSIFFPIKDLAKLLGYKKKKQKTTLINIRGKPIKNE